MSWRPVTLALLLSAHTGKVSGSAFGNQGYGSYGVAKGTGGGSGGGGTRFGGADKCPRCGASVYAAEKIVGAGSVGSFAAQWHAVYNNYTKVFMYVCMYMCVCMFVCVFMYVALVTSLRLVVDSSLEVLAPPTHAHTVLAQELLQLC